VCVGLLLIQAADQQYAEDVTKGYAAQKQSDPAERQQYFYYGSGGTFSRSVVCVRWCARVRVRMHVKLSA
jgi:hypothetical protein